MYKSPDSLLGKLQAIWECSLSKIKTIEEQEQKKIAEVLKKRKFREFTTLRDAVFSGAVSEISITAEKDKLLHHYLGALFYLNRIHKKFYDVYPALEKEKDLFSQKFKEELISSENTKDNNFLRYVVTEFFALQLSLYGLTKLTKPHPKAPGDAEARSDMASHAANARKYDEAALKAKVAEFFSRHQPKYKYKGTGKMLHELDYELEKVLDQFKLENPKTYATNITIDGLLKMISHWKEDEEFDLHLQKHLASSRTTK